MSDDYTQQQREEARDYTPTTEEVRERWMEFDGGSDPDDANEFDRWLAEVRAKAWDEGEASGTSRAMRFMSDEPHLSGRPSNPYREGASPDPGAAERSRATAEPVEDAGAGRERIVRSLSEATGLSPERIHTDRHPLDMD